MRNDSLARGAIVLLPAGSSTGTKAGLTNRKRTLKHPSHQSAKHAAAVLSGTGVHAGRPVHPNLTAPDLVAESLRRREGRLSIDGSLMVETGVHTGRSVRDKFVVDEPSVTRDIWWGNINQRYAPEKFAVLRARTQAYLQGQELFTQDLY